MATIKVLGIHYPWPTLNVGDKVTINGKVYEVIAKEK